VLGDKIMAELAGEKIEINIPAGIQNGTTFRYPGKGKAFKGGQRGDLLLTVKIEMPKKISKEEKEIWEKLKESEKNHKKSWFGL
jgi:molecular chaperone DnaJ